MDIQGKVAVVTGGSGGVGRATALALAEAGCSVAVTYNRSPERAEEVVREVVARGVGGIRFQADVADEQACRRVMDRTASELGRLDILVNNAGTTEFIPHDDLESLTGEIWDRIFAVNLRGAFQCARAAHPHMVKAGAGEIVNVTSIAGITGQGSSIAYCASKAALINLTVSLARALAPTVRVNAVAPGFIEGDWTRSGLGEGYREAEEMHRRRSVLGRVCLPEDVAEAIVGILSGPAMVTGQNLVCDAGYLIGPKGSTARREKNA